MNARKLTKLTSPQRIVDPQVVHQLQRTVKRLEHTIEDYEHTDLPDSAVDLNLTQAIQTLKVIRRNLYKH